MNKFFGSLVKFSIFAFLFYMTLLIFWGKYSPEPKNLRYNIGAEGHAFSRLKEVKDVHDVDVLFLGSSHTYYNFDVRVFSKSGFKSFNLGTNGQTPIQTEFLLDRYLISINPTIVVFEVCPLLFSLDGVESTIEILSNDYIDTRSVSLALKLNHLAVYNTLIYSFYQENVYSDKKLYIEGEKEDSNTYIKGGFIEKEIAHYDSMKFETQEWVYLKEQFDAFQSIVQKLKDKNIYLILVQAPVTSDFYNSYTNNSDFDTEMEKYGNYINYNELLQLDDSLHFFDYHHLNRNGVDIFNKVLIKELIKYQDKF